MAREIYVTASPFVHVTGTIQVPEQIKGEAAIRKYVSDHWGEILFGEPDFDYADSDFDIDTDELD